MSTPISADALRDWLEAGKPVTLVDIRRAADRVQWSIPGSIHIDAYSDLKQGRPGALADAVLPTAVPVVTICNMGVISQSARKSSMRGVLKRIFLRAG